MPSYTVTVNGGSRTVRSSDPDQPLLYVLRNSLRLTGAKFGCGLGQCGACTVILDGAAVRSCMMPVSAVAGREVTTIEGLGSPEAPHPVQAASTPVPAALANAVFDATGVRLRTVPFTPARVRAALAA